MNYLEGLTREQIKIVQESMRYLSYSNKSGSHVNDFRYHPQNTKGHELMKFKVFMELRDQGFPVMVEAIFEKGGGRADIINLATMEIIEILQTETEEEFKEKKKKYPKEFTITPVKSQFKECQICNDWYLKKDIKEVAGTGSICAGCILQGGEGFVEPSPSAAIKVWNENEEPECTR